MSLNNHLKKRKIYLITSINNRNKISNFKKKGYKIILVDQLENKKDFISLYKIIYKSGYSRMLIESGLTFLNSLFKNKTIHDLYIFSSDKKLGKNGKNNASIKYLKKIYPKLLTINLNGDNLFLKEF